jgi:sigma-E factor negative regulatory protein RseC
MNSACSEAEVITRVDKNYAPSDLRRSDVATIGARARRVITVPVRVIEVADDFVWTESDRRSSCTHCSASIGCGVSILTTFFDRKANRICVPNSMNVSLGDEVSLGVKEMALLKETFRVYMLPLLSMLISAVVFNVVFTNDAFTALAAGCGLFAGFAVVRYFAVRKAAYNALKPFLLPRKPADKKVDKAPQGSQHIKTVKVEVS